MTDSDAQSVFGTSILTSSSPQLAATILPTSLESTSKLVDKNFLPWFTAYSNHLQKTNQSLNQLLSVGSQFFNNIPNAGEYGNIPKLWNCLLNSIQLDIHTNELLYKQLKLETIGPLKDLSSQNNIHYSELLINSQELQEISQSLSSNPQAEYQWNVKAPQIFDNFENFKKFEKQLYFNVILNFFQSNNSNLSKNLSNNENSSNYLLSNFKIDKEMANYLDYLLKNYLPNAKPIDKSVPPLPHTTSSFPNDMHLINSSTSTPSHNPQPTSKAAKRQSKIKSKVGSIFGRKNKKSVASPTHNVNTLSNDTIPELALSTTSSLNRRSTSHSALPNKSQESLANHLNRSATTSLRNGSIKRQPSDVYQLGSLAQQRTPQHSQQPQFGKQQQQQQQQSSPPQPERSQTFQSINSTPLSPVSPNSPQVGRSVDLKQQQQQQQPVALSANSYATQDPRTPIPQKENIKQESIPQESPNVVKYGHEDESSSDDDVPIDSRGNRLSMLQKHDLDHQNNVSANDGSFSPIVPPPSNSNVQNASNNDDFLGIARSRQGSDGIYSFEAGDDTQPISATPKQEQRAFPSNSGTSNTTDEDRLPAPDVLDNEESPIRYEYHNKGDEPSSLKNNDAGNGYSGLGIGAAAGAAIGTAAGAVGIASNDNKSHSQPPPPPPSRKVAHNTSNPSGPTPPPKQNNVPQVKDRSLQIFHNLPNARESFVQPQVQIPGAFPTGGGTSSPAPIQSLISQSTGNSILKQTDLFKHNFEDERDGLNTSVAEIINVTFKNGELTKSQIVGEVAFNYNNSLQLGNLPDIKIKVQNKLDKFVVNDQFLKQVGQQEFVLDPSSILSKTLGGLKYLVQLNESQIPLLIRQIWKFENHQASLILILKLNPKYSSKISVNNLIISAALNNLIETTSASSKPEGSFNKDKNRITWRYPKPLVLFNSGLENSDEDSNQEKIIARIMTKGLASEHESGIQVKFSLSEPPVKSAKIVDANDAQIPSVHNLISGNYSSHS
ncbi:hypothetical protein HYPBUDRAFT_9814 [Hyphopichia burtonii NRRL Y-1933]|uniref:MHD domain-containing protein n=1 Tax=Hyphopichia burtonii NRRL Y-1933 TaxID=984485 RepID=A0A1E4RM97_9ASCO|nr:hypothetical protein HYPBUDRAFT_9814 [Hyphopichia burtonii NRRL Y-1933]ODV68311.1 hypothetical protein HYPBUDRAFT_9814 [Hyphopichia burtonii NRRL Y-1933]